MLINIPTGQAARLEGSRGVKRGLGNWDRGRGRRACLLTRAGGDEKNPKKDEGEKGQSDKTCVWKMGYKNRVQGSATQPFLPK